MERLLEYLKVALANLRSNKKRTFLTMLGIIIGISSVIMILAAGGGAKNMINDELNSVFSGMIYFYIDDEAKANTKEFTEEDIRYICDNAGDHLYGATQDMNSIPAKADTIRGNYDIYIDCGTPAREFKSTDKIIKGRYFNYSEYNSASSVGVITEALAKKLFGTTDVIGKSFEINANNSSNEITIIGIRETKQSNGVGAALTGTTTDVIEIPYSCMERKFGLDPYKSRFVLLLADNEYSMECAERVQKMLESRYNVREEGAFGVESWTDAAKQYDAILNIITIFVAVVASIALLVGGIGVMNIMLVSVTERTREIGIRKSLGAKTKAIKRQFMAEAGMITLIGGLIGIVTGLILGTIICTAIGAKPAFSIMSIIVASAFSCGIGLFFGIYPAKKAAMLNPIDALRHE
ncbi:MAG: ABC transporter permease [Lachnospiraceae bacterium]|nr:ABC transporter permease [Lachnospiraceae bacterium]